jgi:hypothetical protein
LWGSAKNYSALRFAFKITRSGLRLHDVGEFQVLATARPQEHCFEFYFLSLPIAPLVVQTGSPAQKERPHGCGLFSRFFVMLYVPPRDGFTPALPWMPSSGDASRQSLKLPVHRQTEAALPAEASTRCRM